ncbi:hypothetical protein KY290_010343 [Solanum tuberosum]|uniref:Uncharacterized protein n=2 Tax=Solanum tuberosum TaxID=4113 RepID=A0ABQ7VYQ6_SOLTU|nr:hypothetical protein KY290_010343 [Solanum tuberosum]
MIVVVVAMIVTTMVVALVGIIVTVKVRRGGVDDEGEGYCTDKESVGVGGGVEGGDCAYCSGGGGGKRGGSDSVGGERKRKSSGGCHTSNPIETDNHPIP